jgi:hypothetical protein
MLASEKKTCVMLLCFVVLQADYNTKIKIKIKARLGAGKVISQEK